MRFVCCRPLGRGSGRFGGGRGRLSASSRDGCRHDRHHYQYAQSRHLCLVVVEAVALVVVRYSTAPRKQELSFRAYHQSRVHRQNFASVKCRFCVAHSKRVRHKQPLRGIKTRYGGRGQRSVNVYCRKKLSTSYAPTSAHALVRGKDVLTLLHRLHLLFPGTLVIKRRSLGPIGPYPYFSTMGRCHFWKGLSPGVTFPVETIHFRENFSGSGMSGITFSGSDIPFLHFSFLALRSAGLFVWRWWG